MATVAFRDGLLTKTRIFGHDVKRRGWRHMSESKYQQQQHHPSSIQIVTWHLNHSLPHIKERTLVALRHLETYVLRCAVGQDPVASCIMFQGVHKDALSYILEDNWVRKRFVVTPISARKWPLGYGNVTLVARTVVVVFAGVLTFDYTASGRNALVVDVRVCSPKANDPQDMVLRMINTHLEPGLIGLRMRRVQLEVLAYLLKRTEELRGGVIAGDMNAITDEDNRLAADYRLKDAWTLPTNDRSGHTWGYQDSSDPPLAHRLDRVLYVERRKSYTIDSPKRIGMGLRAKGDDGMDVGWVSDHYGLLSRLAVKC